MVSGFVSESRALCSNPGRECCDIFLGKILTLIVPPFCLVYKWVMVSCWRKPEENVGDSGLPSTESRETDVIPGYGSIRIIISRLDAKWR